MTLRAASWAEPRLRALSPVGLYALARLALGWEQWTYLPPTGATAVVEVQDDDGTDEWREQG